jgi:hypothetical protein
MWTQQEALEALGVLWQGNYADHACGLWLKPAISASL